MARPPTRAQRLADEIAASISGGALPSGAWLPSERELAGEHGVDRSTVRRALRMLVDRQLVRLVAGTGAQVVPRPSVQRAAEDVTHQVGTWRGFQVSAAKTGREPFTETVIDTVEADLAVARMLGIPTGAPVLCRARRQGIVGDPPVQLSTSYIRLDVVDELPVLRQVDTGPGGMYSRLEDLGYRLGFEESMTCRLPDEREQKQLEITGHQPVLVLWRRCYERHGRMLEVTHRVVVGERHELVYRYDAST